jgi:hypothetical protein
MNKETTNKVVGAGQLPSLEEAVETGVNSFIDVGRNPADPEGVYDEFITEQNIREMKDHLVTKPAPNLKNNKTEGEK